MLNAFSRTIIRRYATIFRNEKLSVYDGCRAYNVDRSQNAPSLLNEPNKEVPMSFQLRRLSFVGIAFVLALLLSVSFVNVHQTSARATQIAAPRSVGPAHFTWIAPTGLTSGDLTIIDSFSTNNFPNAILFVTPNFDPGAIGGTYDPHPVGVVYNTFLGEWEIFNEDGATMPLKAAFNVLVFPRPGGSVFVQTATSANIIGDFTSINNALTNGQPAAQLLITQSFNPFFAPSGTANPHPVGVWYDTAIRQWAVFNEDRTGMPLNASFNILVGTGASGGTESLQTATPAT